MPIKVSRKPGNVALAGQRHQLLVAQLHNSIVTSGKGGLALEWSCQIMTPMIIGGRKSSGRKRSRPAAKEHPPEDAWMQNALRPG